MNSSSPSIEAIFFSLEVDSMDRKHQSKTVSACAVFDPKTLYPIVHGTERSNLTLDDVYALGLTLTDRFEGQLNFSEPPLIEIHHKNSFMYVHIDIGAVDIKDIEPILVEFERTCELFANTAQMKAGIRAQELIDQRQEYFWERKKNEFKNQKLSEHSDNAPDLLNSNSKPKNSPKPKMH